MRCAVLAQCRAFGLAVKCIMPLLALIFAAGQILAMAA
jgi:hypothetical protein